MRYVMMFLIVALVTSCGPLEGDDGVCRMGDGTPVYEVLIDYADDWDDALDIARGSPRIAIGQPISQLQGIRREARNENWPSCSAPATDPMIEYMDLTIDALLAFQRNDDTEVTRLVRRSNVAFEEFENNLDALFPNDD